jgi:P27 family predicted phage terminase small subunit
MPGPKPAPRALKLLKGETRPSRVPQHEPQPRPIRPDAPAFLNKGARIIWDGLVDDLDAMGVLTIVDASILAGYCRAYELAGRLSAYLDKQGISFTTTSGYVQQRAEVAVCNKAWDQVLRYGAELGIGAASRSRIEVKKHDDADEDPTAKAIRVAAVRK